MGLSNFLFSFPSGLSDPILGLLVGLGNPLFSLLLSLDELCIGRLKLLLLCDISKNFIERFSQLFSFYLGRISMRMCLSGIGFGLLTQSSMELHPMHLVQGDDQEMEYLQECYG